MATIEPLRALRYDLTKVGGLQAVVAPPYDVIDAERRAALLAQSPYNVVAIDLPEGGEDPYATAAQLLGQWRDEGVVVGDDGRAIWALAQEYVGPDGQRRIRRGFLARVRIEEYGAGRIRPHERTHPGPKEDRLRLTRATRANLSPIFSLYSDPDQRAWRAIESEIAGAAPWAETFDPDGTVNRLWRIGDQGTITSVQSATADAELLIADGHHRYETARVYAEEIGGEGPHRYVLMCLVALQDPGLTVFPTHRLLKGLHSDQWDALEQTLRDDFDIVELDGPEQLPPPASDTLQIGYLDARNKRPCRLTLKDQEIADAALSGHAEPYRHLDTAMTEALLLKGAVGLTDADIDHLNGLRYARDAEEAIQLVMSDDYDVALFMAPTPVERVQAVAATGESMPPKSTYFFPKVPTGLIFNPLDSVWDDGARGQRRP